MSGWYQGASLSWLVAGSPDGRRGLDLPAVARHAGHVADALDLRQDAAELVDAAHFERGTDTGRAIVMDDGAHRGHVHLVLGDDGRDVTQQAIAVPSLDADVYRI